MNVRRRLLGGDGNVEWKEEEKLGESNDGLLPPWRQRPVGVYSLMP